MATLTIKPTAAGNDVQIKSGDGNTTHATFGDTSTVNMSAGSIASAVTGTLGSGIVFPAGHIIQVVQGTDTTATTYTTSSFTNTPHSALNTSITPTSSTSKILVTINASVAHHGPAGGTAHFKLARDPAGTPVYIAIGVATGSVPAATFSMRLAEAHSMMHQTICYLDSPATTSATTYGLMGALYGATGVNAYNMPSNTTTSDANMGRHMSIITLLEIAQ